MVADHNVTAAAAQQLMRIIPFIRELEGCCCDPADSYGDGGFAKALLQNGEPLLLGFRRRRPSSRLEDEHFCSSTSSGFRPQESTFIVVVPVWPNFVGRPPIPTRSRPFWTDLDETPNPSSTLSLHPTFIRSWMRSCLVHFMHGTPPRTCSTGHVRFHHKEIPQTPSNLAYP